MRQNLHCGNLAQITHRGHSQWRSSHSSQRGPVSHCHTAPLSSHSARLLPLSSNTRQVRVGFQLQSPAQIWRCPHDPSVGKGGNGLTDCDHCIFAQFFHLGKIPILLLPHNSTWSHLKASCQPPTSVVHQLISFQRSLSSSSKVRTLLSRICKQKAFTNSTFPKFQQNTFSRPDNDNICQDNDENLWLAKR